MNAVDFTTPRRHLLTLVEQLRLGPHKVVRRTEKFLALGSPEDFRCPPFPPQRSLTALGSVFSLDEKHVAFCYGCMHRMRT